MSETDELSARVLIRREGAVGHLTLNSPRRRNPLDWSTVRALRDGVSEFEDDDQIRIVLVSGCGGTFSSGGDLEGYVDLYRKPDAFRQFLEDFHDLLDRMERSAKIYIAIVNGYCVAGGLELLLACDIAVAAQSAKIGDAHVNFGQLPGAGGSQRLPRAIGPVKARYLMLTGDIISAGEARDLGLVSAVVDDGELQGFVDGLLTKLLASSAAGSRGAKHLIHTGMQMDFAEALRMEIDYVHHYATTCPDATEGLQAFQEKRKPNFSQSSRDRRE